MHTLKRLTRHPVTRIMVAMLLMTGGMIMAAHINDIMLATTGMALMLLALLAIPGRFGRQPR